MNRHAFLLGFFATGAQVLLLRELVATFQGSELFIGTAMFGWLLWVAVGAWLGGRRRVNARPVALFRLGVLILPLTVVAARLSPLLLSRVIGEAVPFTIAALLSIIAVLPAGLISGGLFPAICRPSSECEKSIVTVYLWEGLGAFAGGLLVAVLVGTVMSTLGAGLVTGAVVCVGTAIKTPLRRSRVELTIAAIFVLLLVFTDKGSALDVRIDRLRFAGYEVTASFDTPYTNQAILSREGSTILVTNNAVEAVSPDRESAENLLLPPLLYRPDATSVVLFGRSEFGVAQLRDSLPGLSLTAVDSRTALSKRLPLANSQGTPVRRVPSDPVRFAEEQPETERFDIAVISVSHLDNYRQSRLLTAGFFRALKHRLAENGLVYILCPYDTDRYITVEARQVLSVINSALTRSFGHVAAWPGATTAFFASDSIRFDIPYDSLAARIVRLPLAPQYVNDYYLSDRLSDLKVRRLADELANADSLRNTLARPLLATLQAGYRAQMNKLDRFLVGAALGQAWWWWFLVPAFILALGAGTMLGKRGGSRFGLFLYFVAGLVSLSLELLSFYVYQSMAGSLYAEMAVLIGCFMLGLSLGTWAASRVQRPGLENVALAVLFLAAAVFLASFWWVNASLALVYYSAFLLVTALATGTLFVAATRRYYVDPARRNRGAGYAVELFGSALGALVVATFLLPMIGLYWLLGAIMALIAATFLGLRYVRRKEPEASKRPTARRSLT